MNHLIAIDEVLGSWQGDDTVQVVELRMLAPGQQLLSDGGGARGPAMLVFDDATGSADTRRTFGGRTCEALGFTGGTLTCSDHCRASTIDCSPTFLVPGGGPAGPECLAEWLVKNPTGRPGIDGKATIRQRCKDGDGGCDADPAAGSCTFTVAVCFDHDDARCAVGGQSCRRPPIEGWTLLAPAPGGAADPLVAAVAAVGPSTTSGGAVTFAPLDATERCTAPVGLRVPTRGQRQGVLKLRARTTGTGGRPRDVDALNFVCLP